MQMNLPVRMALNAIDGMLAREQPVASMLGARLNKFADVLSGLCLYFIRGGGDARRAGAALLQDLRTP